MYNKVVAGVICTSNNNNNDNNNDNQDDDKSQFDIDNVNLTLINEKKTGVQHSNVEVGNKRLSTLKEKLNFD